MSLFYIPRTASRMSFSADVVTMLRHTMKSDRRWIMAAFFLFLQTRSGAKMEGGTKLLQQIQTLPRRKTVFSWQHFCARLLSSYPAFPFISLSFSSHHSLPGAHNVYYLYTRLDTLSDKCCLYASICCFVCYAALDKGVLPKYWGGGGFLVFVISTVFFFLSQISSYFLYHILPFFFISFSKIKSYTSIEPAPEHATWTSFAARINTLITKILKITTSHIVLVYKAERLRTKEEEISWAILGNRKR